MNPNSAIVLLKTRCRYATLLQYCFCLSEHAVLLRELLAGAGDHGHYLAGEISRGLPLVKLFSLSLRTSLIIAVSLVQIGEFKFILSSLGIALNMLS